jgi:hypothetical protein
MSLLKCIEKFVKPHHLLVIVGLLVAGYALMEYSNKKNLIQSGFASNAAPVKAQAQAPQSSQKVQGAPSIAPDQGAPVSGMASQQALQAPSCSHAPTLNPADLLPKDSNSEWANLNPSGNSGGLNMNFLSSQQLAGINTVGSSLRNANLQVRSEPPNPQVKVSPWMNTTIEPDVMRSPFEIGCACPGANPQ